MPGQLGAEQLGFKATVGQWIQRASTAAKYSSVPAAQRCPAWFGRIQRASTALSDSHAVTLQARG